MRRVTFERRNFLHQPEEDEDPERSWVADQHRRDRRRNECFGRYRKKDGGYSMAQPNSHAGSATSQTTSLE